ncbi:unnamed protein product [Meloidogyne enterolobii]|uniref:Uncharacterized protein n=1 Tax=Meloidogyne enterolobii TaxID=390850 RepID=A0ACB0ZFB4_MELEN
MLQSSHQDVPLIRGLLYFHVSNLSTFQKGFVRGLLKVLCCAKNYSKLDKMLGEASYEKSLDNLLKEGFFFGI